MRVIKTLREQILNHPAWISKQDKLRQDFRDEALRLALCRHPHIVQVENVFDLGYLQKMKGYDDKYKIRVGDYRIGISVDKETQTLICKRVAHRKNIYRTFP